jgi:ubiquitin C-terminal hydrolase
MNANLKKLFEQYNLSEKDRFEINQIFSLLPAEKQLNVLKNFDKLIFNLERQKREIELEKRILI